MTTPPPFIETKVPMILSPIPQSWLVNEGKVGEIKVAVLTVLSPSTTALLSLTEADAERLIGQLQAQFEKKPALTIAREMPNPQAGSQR